MLETIRPLVVGLLLVAGPFCIGASNSVPERDFSRFSHDDALAYSQAVIGQRVESVGLTRADGSTVSMADYRGKPLLISMIFSSCHHVCPTTTQYLGQVVAKAQQALGAESFNVVSVGFDTPTDSPQRMAQFKRSTGIVNEDWDFLSGDANAIATLTEQLGFIYFPSARGFDHLVQTSILDSDGKVYRQVYGMSFPTPILIEPLKQLVFGEPREQSTLEYLSNRIRLFCTVYDPASDNYYVDISVFIGTFVGIIVSLLFGTVLVREWRKSIRAER
jgi:protein SCO1/2